MEFVLIFYQKYNGKVVGNSGVDLMHCLTLSKILFSVFNEVRKRNIQPTGLTLTSDSV